MRTILIAVSIALTITATAALGADNSIGTWKLNLEKSKYTPAPIPLKSLTMTREASDGGVKVTTTGERADGTTINASYTAKYDGSPSAVSGTGAPYDTVSIKQVNANTLTDERKNTSGSYHSSGRYMISGGGKILTWTATGTDPEGKAFTTTLVFEKQ